MTGLVAIYRLLTALLLLISLTAPFAQPASAHDVRPAYLQIEPLGPDRYTLLWRTPVLSGQPLPVVISLPAEAVQLSEPARQNLPGTTVERLAVEIPGGLAGKRIRFVGLEATITDILIRIGNDSGSYSTTLVRPSEPWIDLEPDQSTWSIAVTYVRQGIDHILLGFDHLLFVASLLLILRDWRMLVKTITAFTIAHSITLALATFGLVRLPSGPVEIMIAASIVLVAVEAVRSRHGEDSFTLRSPWIVAFLFGLLHGFGFAGALSELGLPQGDIPLALLSFNLGVELGQLTFVAVVLSLLELLRRIFVMPPQAMYLACYAIGVIATFWTFERLYSAFV